MFEAVPDWVPVELRAELAAQMPNSSPAVLERWTARRDALLADNAPGLVDGAVWIAQMLVDRCAVEDRLDHLLALSGALRARFRLRGSRADIDAAVDAAGAAVRSGLSRARGETALALGLIDRFAAFGLVSDVDAAVEGFTLAARRTASTDPQLAVRFGYLGAAHAARFPVRGDPADLDRAVEAFQSAAEAAHTPAEASGHLVGSASALFDRYRHCGDAADLDAALTLARFATTHLPPGPGRASALATMGRALHARYRLTGDVSSRREAARALDAALAAAGPGPARDAVASDLSTVLASSDDDRSGVDRAVAVAQSAADHTAVGARPWVRTRSTWPPRCSRADIRGTSTPPLRSASAPSCRFSTPTVRCGARSAPPSVARSAVCTA